MTWTLRKKEILINILVRLPVKSLIRLLCACKSWNDLIGNSSFIGKHLKRNAARHCNAYLLCLHHPNFERADDPDDPCGEEALEWSLFSNETFEQCSSLSHPLGRPENYGIYGSSNGLICISDLVLNFDSPVHIWNPSVRKFKTLPGSNNKTNFVYVALQFGYHPGVKDYKVVRVIRSDKDVFLIEVYSLTTDCWKMIKDIPPWVVDCTWHPHKGIVFNGVVYHIIEKGPRLSIMSFNSASEEFDEFIAPDAIFSSVGLSIGVYKEEICLLFSLCSCEEDGMEKTDLWVLEEKQWKLLCPFIYPLRFYRVMGITIDNELLIQKRNLSSGVADLHLCNQESKQVIETGIKLAIIRHGEAQFLFTFTYIESLILLDNFN